MNEGNKLDGSRGALPGAARPREIRCGDLIHSPNGECSHSEESVFLVMSRSLDMEELFGRMTYLWPCVVMKRWSFDGPWSAHGMGTSDRGYDIRLTTEEILAMPLIGNLWDVVREKLAPRTEAEPQATPPEPTPGGGVPGILGCVHARLPGQPCPHCIGRVGTPSLGTLSATGTITTIESPTPGGGVPTP